MWLPQEEWSVYDSSSAMQYLFGDTDIAAHRLEILAQVFAESTRALLIDVVVDQRRLALDLGCGTGHTTHLIADTLQCERVVGLDNSDYFLSLAQQTQTDRVSFQLRDIVGVPFPKGPTDLLFCRFLLTHLAAPQAVIVGWGAQLQARGLLLMEETEQIDTTNPVFATYIDVVEAMLAQQSNTLYVGPVLNDLRDTAHLKRQMSRVRPLPVSTQHAATMFYLNMQSWKHQPYIQEHYPTAAIDRLEEDLLHLTKQSGGSIEIEWGMRQLAFVRV